MLLLQVVMHLNDEMLIIVGNTIDIKDAATEIIRFSRLFLILECYANVKFSMLGFKTKRVVYKGQSAISPMLEPSA